MTNSPDNDQSAQAPPAQEQSTEQTPEQSTPPRRTRARRATSAPTKVSTTEPAATAQSPDPGAAVVPAEQEPQQQEPAERPATRARRSRARTAEKAPDTADTPDEGAAEAAPVEETTTKPKRSRRASTSKRQEQAVEETTTQDQAPQDAAPQESAEGEQPAPEPGAAPKRRRASSARTKATPPKDEAADESTERPAAGPSGEQKGTLDVRAELGQRETASQGTADEEARPARTALLFQAPEPGERPRRRRAQAPAGPPKPVDETDPDEQDEDEPTADEAPVDESPTDAEPTTGTSGETSDEDEDDGGGAPRRRRRRGGRGRRSRGGGDRGGDASGDEGTDGPDAGAEDDAGRGEKSAQGGKNGKGGKNGRKAAAESADAESRDHDDDENGEDEADGQAGDGDGQSSSSRRRRRRRRGGRGDQGDDSGSGSSGRSRSRAGRTGSDEVTALKGSTRLEAKRQRRREGRDAGRRRTIVTEAEFLARREAVERSMVVREAAGRVQIAVLEDDVLVEHFVSRSAQNAQSSMAGNVYLGRVQNVLPSMEAAFVDVGKGRNAVLYAGEVNWDAAGLEGQPRRIEQALKSGDSVLVQVTKDPIGHKGARLTSQITLAGRYLVYVPGGGMTGISRKLPENERARLKKLLKEIVPDAAGVIVRTAAEGASDEELRRDVQRLQDQWAAIEKKSKKASAPALLQGEPDLAIRVVRDIFNDDFTSLVVQGDETWKTISEYVGAMAPDLADRVSQWTGDGDVFAAHRIDEQLAKGMDRKVWLPSGGSLVIDRTEAMTVVDVNTGKFTGSGGTLEETVTRNNLEAAEEIVRQLRLRDIGGIIVIDFIDMVLESNRDLVLRRLVECLGRDRTKHQVAEVTSLGLVQMTRKRVGQGLVEAFSEPCEHCHGRGFIVHTEPVEAKGSDGNGSGNGNGGEGKRGRRKKNAPAPAPVNVPVLPEAREAVKATLATIAAAAAHAHEQDDASAADGSTTSQGAGTPAAVEAEQPAPPTEADQPEQSDRQPDEQPDEQPEEPPTEAGETELSDALESVGVVESREAPRPDQAPPSAEAGADGTDEAESADRSDGSEAVDGRAEDDGT